VPAAAFSRGEAVLVRVTAPAAVRAVAATLGSDLRPASAIAPAGRARPPRHAKTFRARRTAARRWDTHVRARPLKGQFKRYFRMTATAYTPINTRMEGGRFTKTQRDGRGAHGMAVDPDLIPLGSRLWIPGYGHAVADDTGGRIQGHRVDLRMQSARQMRAWGVKRAVRVYVLQDP